MSGRTDTHISQDTFSSEGDKTRDLSVLATTDSEKIRTYNQPQDRVTDHRIGFNGTYNGVLLGDTLPSVIESLAAAERAEKLAQAV